MKILFVGFDSAWAGNPKKPGAICAISYDETKFADFIEPELVGFGKARDFIKNRIKDHELVLIAIDQPTVVPDDIGMRLAERVAASVITWLGGAVQPAFRNRKDMFGDHAPIWRFLEDIDAFQCPQKSRGATSGRFIMEVYPALALPAFNNLFCKPSGGPKYNPANRKFKISDWYAVIETVLHQAKRYEIFGLVEWCKSLATVGLSNNERPPKHQQDKLDAAICLLIAIHWHLQSELQSIMIGDTKRGYIVTPSNAEIRRRLERKAIELSVAVDGVVPQ